MCRRLANKAQGCKSVDYLVPSQRGRLWRHYPIDAKRRVRHSGFYPFFNSINNTMIAATQAAQYPQIHCSIIPPFPPGRRLLSPEPIALLDCVGPQNK
jgi:hypothetical protein